MDGKRKKSTQKLLDERKDSNQTKYKRGIPYYDFKVGKLTFVSAKKLEAEVKRREEQTKQEVCLLDILGTHVGLCAFVSFFSWKNSSLLKVEGNN